MESSERRTHFRLPKEARVTVQEVAYPLGQSEEIAVQLVDVSEGGVGIDATRPFNPGTLLQVAILLEGWYRHTSGFLRYSEDAAEKPLTALARVVRCTPHEGGHEIGVQFLDIWDDHWRAMRQYLEQEKQRAQTGSG